MPDSKNIGQCNKSVEQTLKIIMDASPVGIVVFDSDMRVFYVNPLAEQLFGKTAASAVGLRCGDFIRCAKRYTDPQGCGHTTACPNCPLFQAISTAISNPPGNTDQQGEVLLERDAGLSAIWVKYKVRRIEMDNRGAAIMVIDDITERKLNENQLRNALTELSAIHDHAPIAMMLVDRNRRVRKVNGCAAKFANRSTEEMLGLQGGEALRCLHHLDDPRGCGFGPACAECSVRQAVLDTFEDRIGRLEIETWLPFLNGEAVEKRCLLISTAYLEFDGSERVLVCAQDVTERKRVEEALRRSEFKYRRLHESLTDALVVTDMEGYVQDYNPAYQAMLGYSDDELRRSTYQDLTPAKWHAMEARIVAQQIIPNCSSAVYEKEYRRQDGTILPVELRTFLIKDDAGRPAGMWAIIRDITERKLAEQVLQASEKQFRSLFDESPVSIIVHDKDSGEVINANKAACASYGFPSLEELKANDYWLEPPYSFKDALAWIQKTASEGPQQFEWLNQDVAGNQFWEQVNTSLTIIEGVERVLATSINITDRKQAEEALQQSEHLLRIASHLTRMGAWHVSLSENRVTWSDEVAAIHEMPSGYSPSVDEAIGFYAPEFRAKITKVFTACVTKGRSYDEEMQIITRTGRQVWVRTIGVAERDAAGGIIAVKGAFQDISDQKRVEQMIKIRLQLIDFARNHTLSEFLTQSLDDLGELVNSPIGFFHFVEDDQKTLSLQQWSTATLKQFCKIKGRGMRYDLDQAGVWVDCVHARKPIVHNDYKSLPNKKGMPTGHAEVIRELVVPVIRNDKIVAIMGVGNKPVDYTEKDVEALSYLADVTWELVEYKRIEEAHQESEEKYRLLANNTLDVIWTMNLDLEFTYVNPACFALTGYTPQEWIGGRLQAYCDSENFDKMSRLLAERVAEGTSGSGFIFEAEILKKNGEPIPVEIHSKVFFDEAGNPVMVQGVARDISERKQAEDALRKSESFTREILDNLPIGLAVNDVDPNVSFSYMNDNFPRFYRTTREALSVPGAFWDAVYEDPIFREAIKKRILDDCASGDPERMKWENVPITRKGQETTFISARNTQVSGKPLMISSVQDVTVRKQAVDALRKSEAQLQAIIKSNANPIVVYDIDGLPQYLNPAFIEVFGWTVEELKGSKIPFVPDDQKGLTAARINEIYASGKPVKFVSKRLTRNGKILDVIVSAAIIKESPQKNSGMVVNLIDISEQRNLERQLRQAQKMESVGRLAGGVAHDYNNMLSVILGFSELALEKTAPDDPLYDDLKEIVNAGRRSTEITRQLLAFSRRQTIDPIVLDLNDTVEGMLKMLRRLIGEDIDLAWQPGHNLWPISMDPTQIDQILANLCVNARDAIADTGKLTIETHNTSLDDAYCADRPGFSAGEYVLLAISDDGCGMDKTILDNLFEPFFTTKEVGKGTGLGLATVYGIVKQNDGYISVYSEPGKGTTFKIYLPRHAGKAIADQRPMGAEIPRGHGEIVLVVEDDVSVLKLARRLLTEIGYTVLMANTPEKAIELADREKGKIALLITDVIMPGMNGRELADYITARYPSIKTLFMSGYTANVIAHRGVLDDGVAFLHKPFTKRDLAARARQALER